MKSKFGLSSLLLAAVLAGTAAILVCGQVRRGFSTRTAPSSMERSLATAVRTYGIPARYRPMRNPVYSSPEVLHAAEAHWADHCATCHGNDGGGETMFGRTMYPRPPDMSLKETQSMSDGELYYTIQNGIRLSGMPAFGDPGDNDMDTWKLVTFIRHLPQLTPTEKLEMGAMNPKSPDEMQEEKQEQDFLNGAPAQPKPNTTGKDHIQ